MFTKSKQTQVDHLPAPASPLTSAPPGAPYNVPPTPKPVPPLRLKGVRVYKSPGITHAADNAATPVYGAPAILIGGTVGNTSAAAVRYLKIYDARNVAVIGTTRPLATIFLPANSNVPLRALKDMEFDNGICLGATTTVGDDGTVSAGAGEVVVNLLYQPVPQTD